MNLSHTRPILTKCDHTKSIQANLNQTKLKQTKKDHTNVTKIQASPLLSVCPILSTYKLTFTNRTHKLDQTKITINGFGIAKRAAQLLYGPALVFGMSHLRYEHTRLTGSQPNLTSVENESVLGYESGSEPILLPDFSTNPGPNRFFYLNQILKSLWGFSNPFRFSNPNLSN